MNMVQSYHKRPLSESSLIMLMLGEPHRYEMEPYLFGNYTLEQVIGETTVVVRVTSSQWNYVANKN